MSARGPTFDLLLSVLDESLSILFDDEGDHGQAFGDQSIEGVGAVDVLATTVSKIILQPPMSSAQCARKTENWHGNCASFLGRSHDILHLNSSQKDLDESGVFLSARANPASLHKLLSATTSGEKHINGRMHSEKNRDRGSASPRSWQATKNVISFSSSRNVSNCNQILISEASDTLPRKPVREIDNFDDDTGFTDIITVNPYDSIGTTLDENKLKFNEIFSKTVSQATENSKHLKTYNGETKIEKKRPSMHGRRSFDVDTVCFPSTQSEMRANRASRVKEDETPKCPRRGRSPLARKS
jgi:hypothetical protein